MSEKYVVRELDRLDVLIAILSGVGVLALYVRTMAPDILYGDSAELQTLAYTLGHTHSTGYPVYLLLARLVGFVPLNSQAWRITLFSALMGAVAIAGMYLLSRLLTNSRAGACLTCIGLGLSYTLWSQAIITEVYAPGAAFLVWIFLLILHWYQNPEKRALSLFVAALLAALSLGVHATTALAALPAAGFVFLWLIFQRGNPKEWRRALSAGIYGTILGVILWLAAFLYIDWHNPPSSFINTMLYPSRSIWGLTPADMDTPLERISLTMNSVQWNDLLFKGGTDAARKSLLDYQHQMISREFSVWFLLFGLYGLLILLFRSPWNAGYLLASYGFVLFFALNYHPDDQYLFFLSTYIPIVAVSAVGIGALIESPAKWIFLSSRGWAPIVSVCVTLILLGLTIQPALAQRLPSIRSGVARFVREDYQFPVSNLKEPRLLGQVYLSALPDNALVLMEWRDLYVMAYLAYVEDKKPGIKLVEAMPRGNDGKLSASMLETIRQALTDGRPVFAAQRFPGLAENFRLVTAKWYVQIFQKEK